MTHHENTDPITQVEEEWNDREVVAAAHATFHVHPSPESADRLSEAIGQWREKHGGTTLTRADALQALIGYYNLAAEDRFVAKQEYVDAEAELREALHTLGATDAEITEVLPRG